MSRATFGVYRCDGRGLGWIPVQGGQFDTKEQAEAKMRRLKDALSEAERRAGVRFEIREPNGPEKLSQRLSEKNESLSNKSRFAK
jgi:hypothetical protein